LRVSLKKTQLDGSLDDTDFATKPDPVEPLSLYGTITLEDSVKTVWGKAMSGFTVNRMLVPYLLDYEYSEVSYSDS
jgi:hypothetical protein